MTGNICGFRARFSCSTGDTKATVLRLSLKPRLRRHYQGVGGETFSPSCQRDNRASSPGLHCGEISCHAQTPRRHNILIWLESFICFDTRRYHYWHRNHPKTVRLLPRAIPNGTVPALGTGTTPKRPSQCQLGLSHATYHRSHHLLVHIAFPRRTGACEAHRCTPVGPRHKLSVPPTSHPFVPRQPRLERSVPHASSLGSTHPGTVLSRLSCLGAARQLPRESVTPRQHDFLKNAPQGYPEPIKGVV